MRFLNAPMRVVDQLAFSHDGKRLFAAGTTVPALREKPDNRGIAVFDGDATDHTDWLFAGQIISGFAVNPAGRWLYVGVGARYGDPPSTAGCFLIDLKHTHDARLDPEIGPGLILDIHPSGGWLVGAAAGPWRHPGRLSRWRLRQETPPQHAWTCDLEAPRAFACHVAVDPSGSRFVTQELRGGQLTVEQVYELLIRDTADGAITERVPIPGRTVNRLLFSPDGSWLVALGGPSLLAWDATDLTNKPRKTRAGSKHITGVAFHPSGKYLAAASNDETVKLYDCVTWEVAKTYSWDVGRLRSVCFSPDGMRAAVGSDTHKVVVFDVDG